MKICPQCNQPFDDPKHPGKTHCSIKCFQESVKRKPKKCLQCGKEFLPHPKSQKFCSARCGALHRPHPSDPAKRSIFICEWCSKEFETWTYRNPRFCSSQCTSEFAAQQPKRKKKAANTITKPCAICGKITTFKECQVRLRDGKYCSKKCAYAGRSIQKRGSGNPNYRGGKVKGRGPNWPSQKRKALERDGYKCVICGQKRIKGKWNIGVHHIIAYRDFNGDWESANQLTNLITLCRKHHAKVEFGGMDCPRPLF